LLVNTEDIGQIVLAIDSIVCQKDQFDFICREGLGVVHHDPLIAVGNMLNVIFSRSD